MKDDCLGRAKAVHSGTRGRGAVLGGMVEDIPWARWARILDVGGAYGSLLAAILRRHPQMSGLLFDLPHVGSLPSFHQFGAAFRMHTRGCKRSTLTCVPSPHPGVIAMAPGRQWLLVSDLAGMPGSGMYIRSACALVCEDRQTSARTEVYIFCEVSSILLHKGRHLQKGREHTRVCQCLRHVQPVANRKRYQAQIGEVSELTLDVTDLPSWGVEVAGFTLMDVRAVAGSQAGRTEMERRPLPLQPRAKNRVLRWQLF